MKTIELHVTDSDIFKNFTVEGEEVVKLSYSKQIDDVMVSLEGGDVLMKWDVLDWDDEAMLLKEKDNMKEIGGISCTHLLFKSKDGSPVKVYTVVQVN